MAITRIFKSAAKNAGNLLSGLRKPASNVVKLGSSAVASKPATKGAANAVKSAAKAFPTKFAVKGLGGAAVVTGIAGVSKIGFDWTQDIRGLVGLTTPKEEADSILDQKARNQEIDAARLNAEKDYLSFLKDQGLADTPDIRSIYDDRFGGSVSGDTEPQTGGGIVPLLLIGGGVVAAVMVANNLSKKKAAAPKRS